MRNVTGSTRFNFSFGWLRWGLLGLYCAIAVVLWAALFIDPKTTAAALIAIAYVPLLVLLVLGGMSARKRYVRPWYRSMIVVLLVGRGFKWMTAILDEKNKIDVLFSDWFDSLLWLMQFLLGAILLSGCILSVSGWMRRLKVRARIVRHRQK